MLKELYDDENKQLTFVLPPAPSEPKEQHGHCFVCRRCLAHDDWPGLLRRVSELKHSVSLSCESCYDEAVRHADEILELLEGAVTQLRRRAQAQNN